jgi:hypothetical protein
VARNYLGVETERDATLTINPCNAPVVEDITLSLAPQVILCDASLTASVGVVEGRQPISYSWSVYDPATRTVLLSNAYITEGGNSFSIKAGPTAGQLPVGR